MTTPKLEYDGIDLSRIAAALDMWKDGKIDREISEALEGVPVVYVASLRKMIGIDANYKHVKTREKRKAAETLVKDGMGLPDIARILRVPLAVVKTWLPEAEEKK